ncbi:MAG: DUF445 family protein [bacterium]|nr:DUF445 family protein [bacterium]
MNESSEPSQIPEAPGAVGPADTNPKADAATPAPNGGNGADGPATIGGYDVDRLVRFVEKWGRKLAPNPEPPTPAPPTPDSGTSLVLLALKILPFICALGFGASLIWDFQGTLQLPWRTDPIDLEGILRMITVTGLVGFGTNWLAIKMLFYPRKKRPLLGQGLIPSRKDRIATKLGEQISKEIINSELIVEQIRESGLVSQHRRKLQNSLRNIVHNEEFRSDIIELSQHYINQFLRSPEFQERVKDFVRGIDFDNVGLVEGGILRMYKAVTGDQEISDRLQDVIESMTFRMDRYEDRLADYLHKLPEALEEQSLAIEDYALATIVFLIEQVNIQNVIVSNLQRFDEARLEKLLWGSTSDQLNYIQYLGCFLGLIGGLFIWLPVESIVFTTVVGGLVWGLDVLILRMRKTTS